MYNVYEHLEDHDLVILLKEDDEQAFCEIYQRYWAHIYLYSKKLTGSELMAEAIVQQVIVHTWTYRATIVIGTSLKDYLYGSARFKALVMIEKSPLRESFLNNLADFIKDGKVILDKCARDKDLVEKIEKAISNLPDEFKLRF